MTAISTPLADRLSRLRDAAPIRNFHALPLSGALRDMPAHWRARFDALGGNTNGSDVSYSSPTLDSLFAPEGALAHAQELAAEAFRAETAMFGTCGTTVSNRVVLDALTRRGQRVLVDGACHQSVLFSAGALAIQPTVVRPLTSDGCALPDILEIEAELHASSDAGEPYDVVVLTASSYDGYMVRLEDVIPRLVHASPSTAIMIDAAWTAVHAFVPSMNPYMPFTVVNMMRSAGYDLSPIVVTTSAHKSLCALRQASLVLVAHSGGDDLVGSLRSSLFKHHTTSPSWPILASLDLARAHGEALGHELFERAILLRDRFIAQMGADPRLADLVREVTSPAHCSAYMGRDPMKVSICLDTLGDPREIRRRLYDEHGVYVARCSSNGLLLNFTIGVTRDDVDALVEALRALVRRRGTRRGAVTLLPVGTVLDDYVVPYPPGIPIARPGETWDLSHARRLDQEVAAGAEIFRLPEFSMERARA